MNAWRKLNKRNLYSECCNASPTFQEEHLCFKCGKEAKFYDPNGPTMTLEEYKAEQMSNTDSRFDIDLKFGKIYEDVLSKVLTDKTIEVKSERDIWKTTGNIAIEYMSRGNKSGIATTEADWWAHLLTDEGEIRGIIMLPVPELKAKVLKMKKLGIAQETIGGDDNTSRLILLPINKIFYTKGELI